MMKNIIEKNITDKKAWLITGVAGFIGSHLLEELLLMDQEVLGIDNFSTGSLDNLNHVQARVTNKQWRRFQFLKQDVQLENWTPSTRPIDYFIHLAALASVPQSIQDPLTAHASNLTGFLNSMMMAQKLNVKRFVYASSSSVYGRQTEMPIRESAPLSPMSPYAAQKLCNEIYASTFYNSSNFQSVGMRFFNVFGPGQNPNGAYAAVIPQWIERVLAGKDLSIYGDPNITRDFIYVKDVVHALILASLSENADGNKVYNIGSGVQVKLAELAEQILDIGKTYAQGNKSQILIGDPRPGDIPHSVSSIALINSELGFRPRFDLKQGLTSTVQWYAEHLPLSQALRKAA